LEYVKREDELHAEGVAQHLGLDPKNPKFHEAVALAKHIEICKYCSSVWHFANNITSQHMKEEGR